MEIDILRHFKEEDLRESAERNDEEFKVRKRTVKKISQRDQQARQNVVKLKRKRAKRLLKQMRNEDCKAQRNEMTIRSQPKKRGLMSKSRRIVKKHLQEAADSSGDTGSQLLIYCYGNIERVKLNYEMFQE